MSLDNIFKNRRYGNLRKKYFWGELGFSRNKNRDGYPCVLVWDNSDYLSRPVLLRFEGDDIYYGAFDCKTERVFIEIEGKEYSREETVKTKWHRLEFTDLYPTLRTIMKDLLHD